MNTKTLAVSAAAIEQAVGLLSQGGLVAFPTDTVYGLGAHAFMDEAVRRIFRVKGRPLDKPFALFLSEFSQARELVAWLPQSALVLAEQFLPGSLTLILPKAVDKTSLASAGTETASIRVPSHAVPRELVKWLGAPIATTSANLSTHPTPTTAQEVLAELGGRIQLILDGGRCPGGVESTVVDLTGEEPRIVREGAISRQAIEQALKRTLLPYIPEPSGRERHF